MAPCPPPPSSVLVADGSSHETLRRSREAQVTHARAIDSISYDSISYTDCPFCRRNPTTSKALMAGSVIHSSESRVSQFPGRVPPCGTWASPATDVCHLDAGAFLECVCRCDSSVALGDNRNRPCGLCDLSVWRHTCDTQPLERPRLHRCAEPGWLGVSNQRDCNLHRSSTRRVCGWIVHGRTGLAGRCRLRRRSRNHDVWHSTPFSDSQSLPGLIARLPRNT
jgi:hypothetical protein